MSHQTLKAFEIYQNIHFIGIGGIGISALARILAKEGHQISGSDQSSNKNTDLLISENISLIIGHKAENIPPQTDLVIYTTAIPSNNPEIIEAEKRGLKSLTYPQAIGLLTKKYRSICIAGTHGKTTTTAMLGLMMEASGADPTIIVGSLIPEFGHKNDRLGNSPWLVLESCEYKDAFLNYFPEIVVLTCIDPEHLDYFGTPEKYLQAFKNFLDKIPPHGALITNTGNKVAQGEVRATLPVNVRFVKADPSGGEDVTYSDTTREIVWRAGNVSRGTGFVSAARKASFQIAITPSLSQVGSIPLLLNDSSLAGQDLFTTQSLRTTAQRLTTKLSGDPAFPSNGDRVVQ
jgi:UDP-N-acetylmuramate-alanine ligase